MSKVNKTLVVLWLSCQERPGNPLLSIQFRFKTITAYSRPGPMWALRGPEPIKVNGMPPLLVRNLHPRGGGRKLGLTRKGRGVVVG